MKNKQSHNFLIGLIIGTLIGVAIWYWQKSTSAEDGALDLLDRLANAERRMNQMRADLGQKVQQQVGGNTAVVSAPESQEPDDLTQIKGIGPTYASRLHAAKINSYTAVKQLSVAELAAILNINESWAERILQEAQAF